MADIKGFRAIRYTKNAGDIKDLACPPYDIISEEERLKLLENNPHNMIRLELPKGENPYEEAKSILDEWLENDIMTHDEDEGIYIYEEEFRTQVDHGETKKLRGFICRVRVEEFSAGVVLPHEETLSKAKTDRLNLMKSTFCNFSQIYSLYIDEKHTTEQRLDNLVTTTSPRYEFDDGLVIHRMWVINDKLAIQAIAEDFADRKLYIADGHHRYETAINFKNYCRENHIWCPGADYVMMMLVDMAHPGLVVFPTHRLIRDIENFDGEALIENCKEYFDIEKRDDVSAMEDKLTELYNEGKKAFGYYGGNDSWTLLTLRDISVMDGILPDKSEASRQLDVSILHNLVLEKLLGIDKENMANQVNLTYTRSFDEAIGSVNRGDSQCAFIINPTRVEEIGAVARTGEKMPQKSTYFYPKIITGLCINDLNT
ncbi:MAG: DUF1015 domain-containing protein [Clostridia bacterium]|nr:DUF1015 domain-containing protein [Clostridia bacterium]